MSGQLFRTHLVGVGSHMMDSMMLVAGGSCPAPPPCQGKNLWQLKGQLSVNLVYYKGILLLGLHILK
jgi:hypothetical protein